MKLMFKFRKLKSEWKGKKKHARLYFKDSCFVQYHYFFVYLVDYDIKFLYKSVYNFIIKNLFNAKFRFVP